MQKFIPKELKTLLKIYFKCCFQNVKFVYKTGRSGYIRAEKSKNRKKITKSYKNLTKTYIHIDISILVRHTVADKKYHSFELHEKNEMLYQQLWKESGTYEKLGKTIARDDNNCFSMQYGSVRRRQDLPGSRGNPHHW